MKGNKYYHDVKYRYAYSIVRCKMKGDFLPAS